MKYTPQSIHGVAMYLTVLRLQSGQLLIVASSHFDKQALKVYRLRWQIEHLFKAFKTAGFNLEQTHLTDPKKVEKLIALTSIAFLYAYKTGIYMHVEVESIEILTHQKPQYFLFSYGLDELYQGLVQRKK